MLRYLKVNCSGPIISTFSVLWYQHPKKSTISFYPESHCSGLFFKLSFMFMFKIISTLIFLMTDVLSSLYIYIYISWTKLFKCEYNIIKDQITSSQIIAFTITNTNSSIIYIYMYISLIVALGILRQGVYTNLSWLWFILRDVLWKRWPLGSSK